MPCQLSISPLPLHPLAALQNLADCLAQSFESPLESCEERAGLDTFLVYNQRRKVGAESTSTSWLRRSLPLCSQTLLCTPASCNQDSQPLTAHV